MSSAPQFQASLDARLAAWGRPATLERRVGGVVTLSADLTVFLRFYQPAELVEGSGIMQGDSQIIISSTDLAQSGWAGGAPRSGDFIKVAGSTRLVQSAAIRPLDVGYDLRVRG